MASRMSVNFISEVTSCLGLLEEPHTANPISITMGISHVPYRADGMTNSTQPIILSKFGSFNMFWKN